MDDILPLAIPQNMKTQSFAITEVKTLKHTHTWVIKGFSQCECRYLETVPVIPSLDNRHSFRVRLHPQGNKESNKDFCFFQVFSQTSLKYRAKFCVANVRGEEIPATVYNGTQQLNGYFEYIRREQLIQHVQPQDEIKLSLQLTIVQDTVTRNTHVDPGISIPPELTVRTMARQLGEQFKDPQFTDFTVKCIDTSSKQDKEIKCHRFMLYSRSPVFRAMLQEHTLEFKKSEVYFDDIEFDIMQLFIEFLYSGNFNKVSKDHTVVQELLKLGDRFEVMELREAAEIALRQNLNIENVCEVLQIADLHNTKALKRECLRFVCNNAVEVLRTDSWTQLSTHCPDLVTACMSHMVKSEDSDDPPSKRFRSSDCS
jgi:speckle-type POZ protein